MSEYHKPKDFWLLYQASAQLKIPAHLLKLNEKGEVILIDYPHIMLGDPRKPLNKKDMVYVKHLVEKVNKDIHFIVNQSTPFRDKTNRFLSVQHNMTSAFFNMAEIRSLFPHLEIYMPDGINDIKPGDFWTYLKPLNCGSNFQVKKYVPPFQNTLQDQFGITFQLQHPQGRNHVHTVQIKLRNK